MEARDRLFQTFSPDESHRVIGTAPLIDAQAVHGDHTRVFEPAGNLGLELEAGAATVVARMPLLDQLQRDFSVQLLVASDEHLAQPSPGEWPEHVEPLDAGVFRAEPDRFGVIGREVRRVEATEEGKAGIQLRVGDVSERLPGRATRPDRGQAATGIAAVTLQVFVDQRLQQVALVDGQGPLFDQDPVERPRLVEDPRADRGDEGLARDEVHLHRQDTEEQVAVGAERDAAGAGGPCDGRRTGTVSKAERITSGCAANLGR